LARWHKHSGHPSDAYGPLAAANTASDAIYKTCKTVTSLAQAKTCWSRSEAVERAFLTAIFAIAYPPSMKADVDAKIAGETKTVSDEATLAANPNDSAAFSADRADGSAETAAANIVRHDLGLPQVTVPTP
jgi:hypothetical protein